MSDTFMSKFCANPDLDYWKDIGRPDYEQANIDFLAMENHFQQRYVDRKAVGTGF